LNFILENFEYIYLPILIAVGIFLINSIVFRYFDIFWFGFRACKKNLKKTAIQLNLKFIPPTYKYEIGKVEGLYKGYNVQIEPDSNATITVALKNMPNIEFRKSKNQKVNPKHIDGGKYFNEFFKTRTAHKHDKVEKGIQASKNEFAFLKESTLAKSYIDYLSVDEYDLRISLKHGFNSYIPAKLIKPLLDDLTTLAKILEKSLKK